MVAWWVRVGLPPPPPWRGVARVPPLVVKRVWGVARARLRAARRWCVMGDKFRGLGVAWARSCAAHPVGEWWGTECMLVCGFWGVLLSYVRLL